MQFCAKIVQKKLSKYVKKDEILLNLRGSCHNTGFIFDKLILNTNLELLKEIERKKIVFLASRLKN